MYRKIHYIKHSGRSIDDEYYTSSWCGLNDNSKADWTGTKDIKSVTCKKCLRHKKDK